LVTARLTITVFSTESVTVISSVPLNAPAVTVPAAETVPCADGIVKV
jgi:hypothetical protein